ncbi:MAG TPA: hypothetical protein VIM37_02000 [Candidatus Microsaccharimonas sp.]|jgi:hypothetical protein
MAVAHATLEDIVEKRIAELRSLKAQFTDAEIREVGIDLAEKEFAMSLLSDEELFRVEIMLFKITVDCKLDRYQLADFFYPDEWFIKFDPQKQLQVTKFVATKLFMLKGQHARLIWCGPKKDAFRFEKPLHPVTSR